MDSIAYGRRTIPSAIDELAQLCPTRPWVSFATDDQGLRDVSFQGCAQAVNKACWWLKATLGTSETVAYIGPNDIRYLIIFSAAAKCGYRILFTSPRNSPDGHAKLFQETNCTILLHDSKFNLRSLPKITSFPVPDLEELLSCEDVPPFPYDITFDQVEDDPCVILHTSGTTSLPKPVVLTHGQLAVFDAQWQIPPLEGRITFLQAMASCSPFLITLPFFHMAGFSMGIWLPLNLNTGIVFTNPSRPLSLLSVEQVLDRTQMGGAILPPSILQEAADSDSALNKIARLKHVFYGGAPLRPEAGLAISAKTHLCNQIGSTECVVFTTHLTDPTDWDYLCFGADWSGYEFHHMSVPDIFEMVLVRDDNKPNVQAVFRGNQLARFPTGDLYSKHPTKPHHWKHRGRLDDVIILSHGEKINPISNEDLISSHPLLSSAMYVGNRRPQPAAILELAERPLGALDDNQIIESVWPLIEQANASSPSHGQLHRSHLIIADASKKFLRTTKGTLKRLQTVQLFEQEIRDLYDAPVETPKPATQVDITHHDELREFVLKVYRETTGFGLLQMDEDIFQVGADSLKIQSTISTLKASVFSPDLRLETSWISQKAVYANPTARAMTSFLENLGRPQGALAGAFLDQVEVLQNVYERYRQQLPFREDIPGARTPPPANTVLLTGSTGNLGSYLLDMLLRRNDVDEIICLNRGAGAAERQRKGNAERELCTDFTRIDVWFMQADLSQPVLGLHPANYEYILSRVTVILHNQWPVNFNFPLSFFEPHIQGVVNLVDFAVRAAHRPDFFFVSSMAAVNNWRRQIDLAQPFYHIPERHFTDLSLASNGYGQSKAIASDLLYYASSQCGLRGGTIRLGQVAGPAMHDGGAWNTNEWLPSLVRTSHILAALPQMIPLLNEVDWIPVDSAAQVIVELALDIPADPADPRRRKLALFNVTNPHPVSWETLLPVVRSCLGGVRIVPYTEWLRLLLKSSAPARWGTRGMDVPALKLLDFFRELQEGHQRGARQTLLQTERTRKLSPSLAKLGPVDESMMIKWMRQWGLQKETLAHSVGLAYRSTNGVGSGSILRPAL
ncbi:acetyl-CoA synthetase-like protein [Xylaria digitata]|nr:acetyl-CoA synthetase-like protein [Xylaria digitata]